MLRKKEKALLTAQVNLFLDMALSSKEKTRDGEVDIFYGIFNSRDYKELNDIPMDSPKRCARATELLQGYLPISDDIIKKINDWYKSKIRLYD